MTPALLSALTSSPPPLPILWRGRLLFTADHVEAILDSLSAGVPLAATLRAVLGPTTAAGMFGRRRHDERDASAALAAACAACPALAREVDAAEAEGRARLWANEVDTRPADRGHVAVDAVDRDRLDPEAAAEMSPEVGRIFGGEHDDIRDVPSEGRGSRVGHEAGADPVSVDINGGAAGKVEAHAQQGATAEARAQEEARSDGVYASAGAVTARPVSSIAPAHVGAAAGAVAIRGLSTEAGHKPAGGADGAGVRSERMTDEGPGALRAPEPLPRRGGTEPQSSPLPREPAPSGSTTLLKLAASPAVAQAPAWREAVARSAALDAEAAPRIAVVREMPANPNAEKWARARAAAAAKYGPGLLGLLLHQDDLLAARGMHRISPWWLSVFAAFFAARLSLPWLCWILALVGRGGGKSSTLLRFMLVVALFSERDVPPSEAWQWLFISVLKEDARKRIFEAEKLLRLAYGLDVKVLLGSLSIETEDAAGNAIEILSAASTIAGASGPSTMGVTVDEAAKMRSVGANPDVELVVSLAETSRARAGWIGVRCSSAWLMRGAHHAAIIRGSNSANFVATIGPDFIDAALAGYEEVARWESAQGHREAAAQIRAWARTMHAGSPYVPVWTANSTISAMASRQLLETVAREPGDEDIPIHTYWLRESGSMPLAGDGGPDFSAQCMLANRITMGLAEKTGGRAQKQPSPDCVDPMKLPGMRPEDARYAGPPMGTRPQRTNWRTRKAF